MNNLKETKNNYCINYNRHLMRKIENHEKIK